MLFFNSITALRPNPNRDGKTSYTKVVSLTCNSVVNMSRMASSPATASFTEPLKDAMNIGHKDLINSGSSEDDTFSIRTFSAKDT